MTPDPIVIDESATVDEAVRMLEENEISGLPVVDREGLLLGVISQTDIVRARAVDYLWHRWPGLRVRHLMHSPALTADRSMSLEEAAQSHGARSRASPRRRRRRPDDANRRDLDDRPGARPGAQADRWLTRLDLTKEAGEPKEMHEARLARALPMFDVHQYVDGFRSDDRARVQDRAGRSRPTR